MNGIPSGLAIGAIMTQNPVSIDAKESLQIAYDLMDKFSCHHLAVEENGELVGVLSHRDLGLAENVTGKDRKELTVGEAYVAFPYRANKYDPLDKVLDDMLTLQIGSVLVVENEKLVGILTTHDVCRILRDMLQDNLRLHTGV